MTCETPCRAGLGSVVCRVYGRSAFLLFVVALLLLPVAFSETRFYPPLLQPMLLQVRTNSHLVGRAGVGPLFWPPCANEFAPTGSQAGLEYCQRMAGAEPLFLACRGSATQVADERAPSVKPRRCLSTRYRVSIVPLTHSPDTGCGLSAGSSGEGPALPAGCPRRRKAARCRSSYSCAAGGGRRGVFVTPDMRRCRVEGSPGNGRRPLPGSAMNA